MVEKQSAKIRMRRRVERRFQQVPWARVPSAGPLLPSPPPKNGSAPNLSSQEFAYRDFEVPSWGHPIPLLPRGLPAAHAGLGVRTVLCFPGSWEMNPNPRMVSTRRPVWRVPHRSLRSHPRAPAARQPSFLFLCLITLPCALPPALIRFAHFLPPRQTPVLPGDRA